MGDGAEFSELRGVTELHQICRVHRAVIGAPKTYVNFDIFLLRFQTSARLLD